MGTRVTRPSDLWIEMYPPRRIENNTRTEKSLFGGRIKMTAAEKIKNVENEGFFAGCYSPAE